MTVHIECDIKPRRAANYGLLSSTNDRFENRRWNGALASNKLSCDRGNSGQSLPDLASTFENEPARQSRGAIIMAGALVKALREEAGLSQSALAEKAGTTQARISIIENGTGYHGPSVDVLARIASACGKKLRMTAHL